MATFDECTTNRLVEILKQYRRVSRVGRRSYDPARVKTLIEELCRLTNTTHPKTALHRAREATEHLRPLEQSGRLPGTPRGIVSIPIVGSRTRSYE